MPAGRVMTLRLEPELRKQLDGLAKAQRRSRSLIAADEIRENVALYKRQIVEISKGLAEAEQGQFASQDEVQRVMSKWIGRKRARRAR